MDFTTAEKQFNELQARIQRGESLSEDQYQEELAKLMVQDDHGTFWSLEPGTGRWLYFDGTEWIPGTPPRMAQPTPPAFASPVASSAPETFQAPSAHDQPHARPDPQGVEPENVQTYVRAGELPETGTERPGGIPPRPVREATYGMGIGPEERPWLPFAFGAVVLLLCAVALFFGTRTLGLFSGSNQTPVAKVTATEEASPTEAATEAPTKTPQPSPTKVAPTATPAAAALKATASERVKIRSGPGTSYDPPLGTVDKGTPMTVIGKNADSSWLQVQLTLNGKNTTGWVSKDFVTVTGDLNTVPVVGAPVPTTAPAKAGTKTPTPKPTKAPPTATPSG